MSHLDPGVQVQIWIAVISVLTSLAGALAALAGWLRSRTNSGKLDQNTQMTTEIHAVTNGPLAAMGQNVTNLGTQASANAAEARTTAEAAKVQAATDAKASKES